jgi:hypothetical protein
MSPGNPSTFRFSAKERGKGETPRESERLLDFGDGRLAAGSRGMRDPRDGSEKVNFVLFWIYEGPREMCDLPHGSILRFYSK